MPFDKFLSYDFPSVSARKVQYFLKHRGFRKGRDRDRNRKIIVHGRVVVKCACHAVSVRGRGEHMSL